jgi:hypothetical protein
MRTETFANDQPWENTPSLAAKARLNETGVWVSSTSTEAVVRHVPLLEVML